MKKFNQLVSLLTIMVATTLLTSVMTLPIRAEEPEGELSQGFFAPYSGPESYGTGIDTDYLLEAFAQDCIYNTKGDNPHVSRTGIDVSAHGWWTIGPDSGPCPTHADVEVWLQGWWCQEGSGCWWRELDHDKDRIRAGGGAGNRINVRKFCTSHTVTGFRSIVDVDLVGVSDPPDKLYIIIDVPCYPPNP